MGTIYNVISIVASLYYILKILCQVQKLIMLMKPYSSHNPYVIKEVATCVHVCKEPCKSCIIVNHICVCTNINTCSCNSICVYVTGSACSKVNVEALLKLGKVVEYPFKVESKNHLVLFDHINLRPILIVLLEQY